MTFSSGVLLPLLMVGGFMLYYSNKTVEIKKMKAQIEDLQQQLKQEDVQPAESPKASVISPSLPGSFFFSNFISRRFVSIYSAGMSSVG
jgi:hypothetical protein